jgi:tetratricopeptide (TPR) repeat protein
VTDEVQDDAAAEEREFLLGSLRDLEAERAAGDIDDADYVALRDDYTARAAAALRGDAVTEPVPRRRPSWRRRGVAAVAVVGLGVLAGELLARTAGERVAGEQATGSIRSTPATAAERAKALFDEGKLVDAIKGFDAILEKDPDNPEALAYHGWIVHLAGLSDDAMSWLDRAIAADPTYPFAHFFKALVLLQARNDPKGAIPELEAFLANRPPQGMVAPAQEMLRTARDAAAGKVPASTTSTTAPPAP